MLGELGLNLIREPEDDDGEEENSRGQSQEESNKEEDSFPLWSGL